MNKKSIQILLGAVLALGVILIFLGVPPETAGRAVKIEDAGRTVLCVDSDGNAPNTGIFVMGETTLYIRPPGTLTRRYYGKRTDTCLSQENLIEQSCSDTGLWTSVYRQCPKGYTCYNGACR